MRITTPDGDRIDIKPPISVEFSIERSVESKQNNGSFTLYNLAPNTRNAIYKDKYNTLQKWSLQFMAGYKGGDFFEIFRGTIVEAFSAKEGTEWITKIDAFDGSWAVQNGSISTTVAAGTDTKGIVERCIAMLPGLLTGTIGGENTTSDRGEVLIGNPYDVLAEQTDGAAFIDSETVNVLGSTEVFGGEIFIIDQDKLLETPRKRETFIEAKTIFSPEIRVGYICEIDTKESRFNGRYKILGISHSATISGASCGEAVTTLSLDYSGAYKEILR